MKVSRLLQNARLRRLKPKKISKSGTYLGTEIDGEFFEGTIITSLLEVEA